MSVQTVAPATRETATDEPVTGQAAVRVSGLRKTYGKDVHAVRGVSFEVRCGEIFGLLGPNGAGKSTTIGVLTGMVRPTGGSATVGGFDVVRESLEARRASGVVFQDPVLDHELSGVANLQLHARLWGVPKAKATSAIRELVTQVELGEFVERPVRTYSGGQRRRLEIARAMVASPQVLILDEPTVGLDARIRHQLLDLVDQLRYERGVTVLLTTHYLDEAERLADRVAVMAGGAIVAMDAPSRLLRSLGERVLEAHVERAPEGALRAMRSAGIAGDDALAIGNTITVPLRDTTVDAVAAVTDLGISARAIAVRPPTLDDVYLRLTGRSMVDAA